jgi:hypothetical protein
MDFHTHSLSPLSLLTLFFIFIAVTTAQENLVVPWSNKQYGPDGPWQAVKIKVGGSDPTKLIDYQGPVELDVFPGGAFETVTFSTDACKPFENSTCAPGGTWNPERFADIAWRYTVGNEVSGLRVESGRYLDQAITIDGQSAWTTSSVRSDTANITYTDGSIHGPVLGSLALGANEPFQYFQINANVEGGTKFWIYAGYTYHHSKIASYSYGLHIGSAALGYPGSLVFGGYNKGRVVGPLTTFSDPEKVSLLDIGIGVEDGSSPFDFIAKSGLLLSNDSRRRPLDINPDPLAPYLALPDKTCDAIAALLPVNFDKKLKYYLWDTNNSSYNKIVSSAAYLSFSFPAAVGEPSPVVVKVPFKLLNLTLEPPITDAATPYFPCRPYNPLSGKSHVLGRAFLQSAFLGRNWNKKISWLGQAPGPGVSNAGLGDENVNIADDATTIKTVTIPGAFNQSWSGHWTIMKANTTTSLTTSSVPSTTAQPSITLSNLLTRHSLTSGVIAGISVGALAGVAAIIGATLMSRRKSENNKKDAAAQVVPLTNKGWTSDCAQPTNLSILPEG